MIYKLETKDKKTFEITKGQYEYLMANIDSLEFFKANGHAISKAMIADFYPDYETTNERKIQEENATSWQRITGFGQLFLTGNIQKTPEMKKEESIKIRLKLKQIWFEHIKRRPMLNEQNNIQRSFSREEQRIINTPLERLLKNYEEDLRELPAK